jgi:RES domain-containing protein
VSAAFPWAPNALLLWRMDAKAYAASWNSGKGAELLGGRWNPKGFAAVYASVDPSTAVLEVAVHKGFDTLDRVPHIISCAQIRDPSDVHVLDIKQIPNANWLRPGTPGHAQQQFGMKLMEQYPFVALPSAVLPMSWNILFNPKLAAGKYRLLEQTDFALDTRLNPPTRHV